VWCETCCVEFGCLSALSRRLEVRCVRGGGMSLKVVSHTPSLSSLYLPLSPLPIPFAPSPPPNSAKESRGELQAPWRSLGQNFGEGRASVPQWFRRSCAVSGKKWAFLELLGQKSIDFNFWYTVSPIKFVQVTRKRFSNDNSRIDISVAVLQPFCCCSSCAFRTRNYLLWHWIVVVAFRDVS